MKESDKENIEQETINQTVSDIGNSNYFKDETDDVGSEHANAQLKVTKEEVEFFIASCECNFRTLSTILTKNPGYVNMKNVLCNGYTALHFACKFGSTEVIRALIGNYGADVNVISHSGMTPLHVAVQFKQEDAVRMLVSQYNANKAIRDYYGRLPADIITTDDMEAIMKMVGPGTASKCPKVTRESNAHFSSLKKGFQSISSTAAPDTSLKMFSLFRKNSESVPVANPSQHPNHHLPANHAGRDIGTHSSLRPPDMVNIKKSLSIMSSRSSNNKHSNPALRVCPGNKQSDTVTE